MLVKWRSETWKSEITISKKIEQFPDPGQHCQLEWSRAKLQFEPCEDPKTWKSIEIE